MRLLELLHPGREVPLLDGQSRVFLADFGLRFAGVGPCLFGLRQRPGQQVTVLPGLFQLPRDRLQGAAGGDLESVRTKPRHLGLEHRRPGLELNQLGFRIGHALQTAALQVAHLLQHRPPIAQLTRRRQIRDPDLLQSVTHVPLRRLALAAESAEILSSGPHLQHVAARQLDTDVLVDPQTLADSQLDTIDEHLPVALQPSQARRDGGQPVFGERLGRLQLGQVLDILITHDLGRRQLLLGCRQFALRLVIGHRQLVEILLLVATLAKLLDGLRQLTLTTQLALFCFGGPTASLQFRASRIGLGCIGSRLLDRLLLQLTLVLQLLQSATPDRGLLDRLVGLVEFLDDPTMFGLQRLLVADLLRQCLDLTVLCILDRTLLRQSVLVLADLLLQGDMLLPKIAPTVESRLGLLQSGCKGVTLTLPPHRFGAFLRRAALAPVLLHELFDRGQQAIVLLRERRHTGIAGPPRQRILQQAQVRRHHEVAGCLPLVRPQVAPTGVDRTRPRHLTTSEMPQLLLCLVRRPTFPAGLVQQLAAATRPAKVLGEPVATAVRLETQHDLGMAATSAAHRL